MPLSRRSGPPALFPALGIINRRFPIRNLVKKFVESKIGAIHIEDQRSGCKVCGHQGQKVLVSTCEMISRLNTARLVWSSRAPIPRTPPRSIASTTNATICLRRHRSAHRPLQKCQPCGNSKILRGRLQGNQWPSAASNLGQNRRRVYSLGQGFPQSLVRAPHRDRQLVFKKRILVWCFSLL